MNLRWLLVIPINKRRPQKFCPINDPNSFCWKSFPLIFQKEWLSTRRIRPTQRPKKHILTISRVFGFFFNVFQPNNNRINQILTRIYLIAINKRLDLCWLLVIPISKPIWQTGLLFIAINKPIGRNVIILLIRINGAPAIDRVRLSRPPLPFHRGRCLRARTSGCVNGLQVFVVPCVKAR